MSIKKNASAKVEISNLNLNSKQKKVLLQDAKKKENLKGEILNLNLSSLKTESFQFSSGVQNNKAEKYKYPENWTAVQKSLLSKSFRVARRKDVNKFAAKMEICVQSNNSAALIEAVKEFKIYYKENYLRNDFSAESLSDSKDLNCENFILNCVKTIDLQVQKKSAPKAEKKPKLKVAIKKAIDNKLGEILENKEVIVS